MPAPTRRPLSSQFMAMREETFAAGENNDCTVKALAMVSGAGYSAAHAALAAEGRKAKHGTFMIQQQRALAALGYRMELRDEFMFILRYPRPHCNVLKHVTSHHPDRFQNVWKDGRKYLLYTRRHVLAVIDGVCHDWTRNKAQHVRAIYEVVPTTTPAPQPQQPALQHRRVVYEPRNERGAVRVELVKVHATQDARFPGGEAFYATGFWGCGKNAATVDGAIRALVQDMATIIQIMPTLD